MPIHDWTRVEAGIFHHFHQNWIPAISLALNRGLLPPGHYALAEQITGGLGPDVVTLEAPTNGSPKSAPSGWAVALAVESAPPEVWLRTIGEIDVYAAKANVIAIRHTSDHRVVAVIEIVSPGNKNRRPALKRFVDKAAELIWAGIHLMVIDLFPPSPRDPQGIHKLIWDEVMERPFALPEGRPLTLAAYIGGPIPEAFIEPTGVGMTLKKMPLFLTPRFYVPVPLDATYQSAWEAVPEFWRDVLTRPV